jgi:hypothetical protein
MGAYWNEFSERIRKATAIASIPRLIRQRRACVTAGLTRFDGQRHTCVIAGLTRNLIEGVAYE